MTIVVESELDNLIIGGDFNTNPWQRGTSFVSPVTLDYTADRFQHRFSGVQDFTVSRNIDNPSFVEAGLFDSFSLNYEVTNANAGPGAGDFTTIEQPIEGSLALPVYDTFFGISFWVKSAIAGIFCVAFQNDARTRNHIVEYTIDTPNVWQEITIQLPHESAGGTWEIGSETGLRVIFTLNAGATFQGVADTWQAGDLVATANQVNLTATLANTFRIALVRCVNGVVGTAYWMRDKGRELGLCQRYYEKSYNIDVDPGTIVDSGAIGGITAFADPNILTVSNSTKSSMRTTPTVTWYSPVTGLIDNIANLTTASDFSVASTALAGESRTGFPVTNSSITANDVIQAHYTAEAEL